MGRKALFRPRIATATDQQKWQEVERLYGDGANASTRRKVVADFVAFHRMNGRPIVETLELWAGTCAMDGLMWSTIDTYSVYITKVILPDLTPSERMTWRLKRKIIQAAHADEDCGGARVCSHEEVALILSALRLEFRQAVAAIAYTGARCADIRRWRRKQIVVRKNALAVQVRVSKNRRKRTRRRTLRLPDIAAMVGLEMDASLPLIAGQPDDRPFATITANMLNRELATVCTQLGLDKVTTYSFRKFFIKAMIEYYDYDWEAIISKTLHTGIDVVAAHYDVWEPDER